MPRLVPPPAPYDQAALEEAERQKVVRKACAACKDKAVRGALAAPMPLTPGSYGFRAPKPKLVDQVVACLVKRVFEYRLEVEEHGFYIDVAVPELSLALECGVQHHPEPKKRHRDAMKRNTLENYGWRLPKRPISAKDDVWVQVDAALGWARGLTAAEAAREAWLAAETERLRVEGERFKAEWDAKRAIAAQKNAAGWAKRVRLARVRKALEATRNGITWSPEDRDDSARERVEEAFEEKRLQEVFPNHGQQLIRDSLRVTVKAWGNG